MGAAVSRSVPPGSPVAIGDVIAEKYRVVEVVAMGGMGIVVAAEHLQLGQKVAIKVLLPSELTEEPHAVARFLREARAAAGLTSDHVVRIYDVGTLESGLPFMVMELLRGQDLRRIVKTQGPLPVEVAVDYVRQACDAVGEAHDLGIVHRDLKPSNLFLAQRRDGSPLVKVVDFGISKALAESGAAAVELTTSSVMMGSPLYMSPEQVRDARSVDHRTDIWSFGVILYQLLTGKPPFNGDSLPAVCAAIAADTPSPIQRADVPVGLIRVIGKCLAKDPAARYQSIGEMVQALDAFPRGDAPASGASTEDFPSVAPDATRNLGPDVAALSTRNVDPEGATISYNRLLQNRDALRAAPTGITEAPLAATLQGQTTSARSRAPKLLFGVIAAVVVGLAVAFLVSRLQHEPVATSSVQAAPAEPAAAATTAPEQTAEPVPTASVEAPPVEPSASAAPAPVVQKTRTPRAVSKPKPTAAKPTPVPDIRLKR